MADFCALFERIDSPCFKDKYTAQQYFPDVLIFPSLNLTYFFGPTSGYVLGGKCDESESRDKRPEEITSKERKAIDTLLKERVSLCDGAPLSIQRPVLHGSVPLCHQHNERMVSPLRVFPISLDEARLILSEFIQALSRDLIEEDMVTVLCDGSPPTNSVVISASARGSKLDFDEVMFTGHVLRDNDPMESLIEQFNEAASHRIGQTTPLQICSKAYAQYDVLTLDNDSRVATNITSDNEVISSCRLSLEWVWKDVASVLCEPPAGAQCVINAKVVPGDDRSPLVHIYQELVAVKMFLQATVVPDSWNNRESEGLKPVSDIVNELAQETQSASDVGEVDGSGHQATNPLTHLIMPQRGDMDCTERLWKTVKDVRSISYLQALFSAVSKAVVHGIMQPYIYQHNKTSAAAILKECLSYRGQLDDQKSLYEKWNTWFTVENILKCCVEVGLNKLRRDYEEFFLSEELTTLHHLEYFTSDKPGLQEQVSRLESLHCVVEVITAANVYMGLPLDIQRAIVRPLLNYYTEHNASSTPLFSLPLASVPPQLMALCQRLHPSVWVVSFEAPKVDIQHLHVFSAKQLFDMPGSESNETLTRDNTDCSSYFSYKARHHTVMYK